MHSKPLVSLYAHLLRGFAATLVVATVLPLAAAAQDPSAILDRLRTRYETLGTIRATFEQVTSSPLYEGTERIAGTIVLSGDRYRLEAGSRTVVTDGTTIWIYDRNEAQVIIGDYVDDEATFSITGFLYRFDERYRFEDAETGTENGTRVHRIRMLPLDPGDYFRRVTVTMRDSDAIVTKVVVEDAADTTMSFSLGDIEQISSPGPDLFVFDVPDGIEIVDLRS